MDFAGSNDLDGASVLEIGGGIGDIQLELLLRGASRTTNLELSGAYEAEAARLLDEKGLRERAARVVGVDLASVARGRRTRRHRHPASRGVLLPRL